MRLVLLPGMDGTGELFADFVKTLPAALKADVVRYRGDISFSYAELMPYLHSAPPAAEPFVLVAESFSTPLNVQFAAMNPPNLKAVVICAGFVTSPVRGWRKLLASLLTPVLFHLRMPDRAARFFLLGSDCSPSLIAAVQTAISSVKPRVMAARLRAVFDCDVRAELAQITVPILYIQARYDRLTPVSAMEEMRRIKPQIRVATIASPHLILQREPREAAEAVSRFIQQLEL